MRQGVWVRYFTAQSNAEVYSKYRGVLWNAVYCSGGVYPALALVAAPPGRPLAGGRRALELSGSAAGAGGK